nr:MAG TPA: hypothetical protein [Caudoviricetes sp.]
MSFIFNPVALIAIYFQPPRFLLQFNYFHTKIGEYQTPHNKSSISCDTYEA